jgi:hypothetical protein
MAERVGMAARGGAVTIFSCETGKEASREAEVKESRRLSNRSGGLSGLRVTDAIEQLENSE